MNPQRACLAAMALGLFLIVQPFSEMLFAAGFPVTLLSLAAYNAVGWLSGERAEKSRAQAKIPDGKV